VAATETPEVRAQAKWVRMSPRKARLVVEHIRGRTVPEARTVLAFTQRAAAREVEKVLRSAIANAEANHGLVGDELVVSSAVVDEGPTMKRWRARARGRVARIRKPTCHITIKLQALETSPMTRAEPEPKAEEEKPKRTRKKAPAAKKEEPATKKTPDAKKAAPKKRATTTREKKEPTS
jgi:large subunit ribosomal protein L22